MYQPIQGAWSRNQPPCCCVSRPTIQWVRPERSYMRTLIPMFHKRHGMIECIIQSGQTWILLFRAYCTVPSKFPSLNWRFWKWERYKMEYPVWKQTDIITLQEVKRNSFKCLSFSVTNWHIPQFLPLQELDEDNSGFPTKVTTTYKSIKQSRIWQLY